MLTPVHRVLCEVVVMGVSPFQIKREMAGLISMTSMATETTLSVTTDKEDLSLYIPFYFHTWHVGYLIVEVYVGHACQRLILQYGSLLK